MVVATLVECRFYGLPANINFLGLSSYLRKERSSSSKK